MAHIAVERVEDAGRRVTPDETPVCSRARSASLLSPTPAMLLRERPSRTTITASLALSLCSCLVVSFGLASQPALAAKKAVELVRARSEIPEERLLDIGIRLFDPGFPENPEAIAAMKNKGVPTDLRRAEARYFPYQLMQTLQSTGFWGTVRVVPDYYIVDVAVSATISTSTEKDMKIKVFVQDARGKKWLKKKYKGKADYSRFHPEETRRDPYQSLYNRIANDIRKFYLELDDDDVRRIREISRLRFAAALVPDAFGDYLRVNKKGRYRIERLPATDDPMMTRVASVRERDHMFVDTFQEYYADFHAEMRMPYDDWRERSFNQHLLAKKLGRKGLLETLLGVGIVAAGAAAVAAIDDDDEDDGGSRDVAADLIMDAATTVGTGFIEEGIADSQVARMHRRELNELAQSIDRGVAPVLVKFEGDVIRLTGSMEAQYADWRKILRQIFATETGLSPGHDVSIEPAGIISRRMATTLKPPPK